MIIVVPPVRIVEDSRFLVLVKPRGYGFRLGARHAQKLFGLDQEASRRAQLARVRALRGGR